MKKLLPLIFLSLLAGCNLIKVHKVNHYTIEQFFDNESIYGGSFSYDENHLLITSNKTGIYNAFALKVDGSGEEQLTFSENESVFAVSYFPDDNRFLYTSDRGGNEINHLYLQDPDGTTTDLTPWEGAKSSFNAWSHDRKSFFFISNKRDPKYFDLYEFNIESLQAEMIYENNENLQPVMVSNTRRYLVLVKELTTSNNEMYLLDMQTGQMTHISEHIGMATYSPADFTLSDDRLYYLTNEDNEFTYVASYDMLTGEKKVVFRAGWDVMYAYNSFHEKYRVIGINKDAKTVVQVFEISTGNKVDLPEFKDGSIHGVSIPESEDRIRLTVGSSTSPNNIFVYSFRDKRLLQLTNTLNPEIEQKDLVEGEVIRYPSYDSLEIPAILYEPRQASENNRVPALVWVHGGPGGQSRIGFNSLIQFLVNHGYALLAVNNRGSSGYGKTFYNLDNQRHGEDDLMDCVKAKDYLSELDYINPDKIGIIGGSYGGYMVMAALTFKPEVFDVGVNIFGVTNWLRTLKSIPSWWEAQREALYTELGNPYTEDSVRLKRISPLFHAEQVKSPLMVLQGANDPRVLQVESDEIVESVRANGVPVEYIIFNDEGHGFRKKENQIEGYGKILTFLDTYLKGEPSHR